MNRETHAAIAREVVRRMPVAFTMRHMDPGPNHGPSHRMARHRLNKLIRKAVWASLLAEHALPTSAEKLALAQRPEKRCVKFTRFFGGRVNQMDKGNFVASCKAVLDALKLGDNGEGLIFDDRPEWLVDMYLQEKDPAKAGVLLVEVSPV